MTTTFTINKIDCSSCVMMIESVCEDFPGVRQAEVQTKKMLLTVEHDTALDVSQLQSALQAAGYPVSPT